jgi:V/A-type H+-transporting ATPase subunit I
MLRPEKMSRVILVGPREALDQVTEILYELRLVHLVDYRGEDEAFRIGKPSEKASRISEDLVKLRSISSILEAAKVKKPSETIVGGDIRQNIKTLEINIVEEDSSRKKAHSLIADLDAQIAELAPFAELGLGLEAYGGYEGVEVFVGRVSRDIGGLDIVSPENELFRSGDLAAVFVPKERTDAVRDFLSRRGFSALDLPKGSGDPRAKLSDFREQKEKWQKRLSEINERLAKLRERYAGFVLAAERQLGAEIEKAEAPLRFATSEHSFVIDGWVPAAGYEALQSRLKHIEPMYISTVEGNADETPTLLKNAAPLKPFEAFIHLFSTPSYKELDPTLVLALIFPIFFGFMIGDAGYGALWLVLGGLLVWKLPKGGFKDLMFAITLGGFFALIFGLFLYGEAFGLPFIALPPTAENPNPMGWDVSVGISIPIRSVFHKLENPVELILLSMIAAFIHLGVGFVFGVINEWRQSKKHSVAKVAWLVILSGLFMMIVARFARWPGFSRDVYTGLFGWLPQGGIVLEQLGYMATNPIPTLSIGMIIGGLVVLIFAEGALAPFEIPGLIANMISYARLAGVALAKAATAMAFNTIIFTAAAPGGAYLALAVLIAFLAHALIFVLGAISAGIQAVRLNYVEFFLKFFKGNGTRFRPFGLSKAQEV